MTNFVQFNNGSIRRVRNSFGGATAWKQHTDDGVSVLMRDARTRRIAELDMELAMEELDGMLLDGGTLRKPQDEAKAGKKRRRNRGRKSRYEPRFERIETYGAAMPMTSTPVVKEKRKPTFRVVISPSGKMIAVPLEAETLTQTEVDNDFVCYEARRAA